MATRKPPAKKRAKSTAKHAQGLIGRWTTQALGLGQTGDWRLWLQRFLVLAIAGVVVLLGIFFIAYEATTIPDANAAYQAQSSLVTYADGSKIGQFGKQNRQSVSLADVPKVMQDAIVAAEDRSFWTNRGIDPRGILRAAFSDAKGGATQGGSTITQQYVKLLYLSQEQTITRKIKEAFLSLKVQQERSKQEVLEGYLNIVYFGRGAYGVQAAAQTYFGEDAKQLTLPQAAMLASIVKSPSYLSPDGNDEAKKALLDRENYVLDGMVSMGTVDATAADKVRNHLPDVKPKSADNVLGGQRGFAMDLTRDALKKIGFTDQQIDGAGLRVTTTLDPNAMASAEKGVTQVVPPKLDQMHVGVASIDVKSGALLAFYGGQDYIKSQINWANYADSPGSVFKVFGLSMALSNGWGLKNTFDGNSPLTLPQYTVQNEGERSGVTNGTSYGHNVSLLDGLIQSINTVYVDMTYSTPNGAKKIRDTAVSMGIPDKPSLQPITGIVLGVAPVAPIDIANAYSTIANGGNSHPWFVVSKVTDSNGRELWSHKDSQTQALTSQVAADVSYAMQQVVQNSKGTGINAQALGRPVAGKTGTATDANGDVVTSWFAGFTPQVSTAVMYVRGNGRQPINGYMPTYFGADYPTRTWVAVMNGIVANMDVQQFPPPGNVQANTTANGHAPYVPPPPPPPPSQAPPPSEAPSAPPSQPVNTTTGATTGAAGGPTTGGPSCNPGLLGQNCPPGQQH